MKRVTIDLEDEQFEQLRKAAFDRHEPMAAIVREALHKHLDDPASLPEYQNPLQSTEEQGR